MTLLLSGSVFVLDPWQQPAANTVSLASYKAPPVSGAGLTARGGAAFPVAPGLPAPRATTTGHNPAFDVAARILSGALPHGTELHLIGVYQGAPPDGAKEAPWWAKCTGPRDDPAAMRECHGKYAGQRTTQSIAVDVTRSTAPLALVLMSYEPVLWKLSVGPKSRISKIILAGYHGQDIEGIPANVPIEARTREASPCRTCSRQGEYFYAYKQDSREFEDASKKLKAITGIAPTSFQGSHRANRFFIGNQTVSGAQAADPSNDAGDIYIGKPFKDQVRIAGHLVSLPAGTWQGLADIDAPSTRGRDKLVALGRVDAGPYQELIAIRVQTVSDASGFPHFSGCKTAPNHASQVTANESFGRQLCYEVAHVTDAWSQPLLAMAAKQLRSRGAVLPDTVAAASFHNADLKRSVDLLLYALPAAQITSENQSWDPSSWHPTRLKPDSDQGRFIQEQVNWAAMWYQIFALSP